LFQFQFLDKVVMLSRVYAVWIAPTVERRWRQQFQTQSRRGSSVRLPSIQMSALESRQNVHRSILTNALTTTVHSQCY